MGYLADRDKLIGPLDTDYYQLTMAQGYFDQGRHNEFATFYMHWRNPPFGGGYTVAAGLEGVVDFLKSFKFTEEDIAFLRSKKIDGKREFTDEFLDYLKDAKLDIDVDAVPEGTVMTGPGPVVRISGPLAQCQLVESAILNIINSDSIVATRAARLREAVGPDALIADFSLRRAPGISMGTLNVPRAAYVGGVNSTASPRAEQILGIPCIGTMAHAWIMGFQDAVRSYTLARQQEKPWQSPYSGPKKGIFENHVRQVVDRTYPNVTNSEVELAAFRAYLQSNPTKSVLLVDTYDTVQGVKNAIQASIEMNTPLKGVRLDSGDLYAYSWAAHDLLKAAAQEHPSLFSKTRVFATDGLTEDKIQEMRERSFRERGCDLPITAWGVGTNLGNPGPFNGGVYKISATGVEYDETEITQEEGEYKTRITRTMKISEPDPNNPDVPGPKSSLPGVALDTLRLFGKDGSIVADVIVDHDLEKEGSYHVLQEGRAVDLSDNVTQAELPEYAEARPLLAPVFRRRPGQEAAYIMDEAAKKPPFEGSTRLATDLNVLRDRAADQRSRLPEGVRRFRDVERLPVLLSNNIDSFRRDIFAHTRLDIPGNTITGSLHADGPNQSLSIQ